MNICGPNQLPTPLLLFLEGEIGKSIQRAILRLYGRRAIGGQGIHYNPGSIIVRRGNADSGRSDMLKYLHVCLEAFGYVLPETAVMQQGAAHFSRAHQDHAMAPLEPQDVPDTASQLRHRIPQPPLPE